MKETIKSMIASGVCALVWLGFANTLQSQVVTSIPSFPTTEDSIIVIFNAKEGDGGLEGHSGDVYAHTGVITDQSSNSADWKYVIGTWGNNSVQPQLTNIGEDLWQLTIGDVREFYGIPDNVIILKLAFVFRSANTQRTGRDVGGADIFLDLFEPGLSTRFLSPRFSVEFGDPRRSPVFATPGDTIEIVALSSAEDTSATTMSLFVGEDEVATTPEDTLRFDFIANDYAPGFQQLTLFTADSANVDTAGFLIMVNEAVPEAPQPAGIVDGINITGEASVTLSLFAPRKEFVYVIGDFNDWKVDPAFFMMRDSTGSDSVNFWLTLDGLDPDTEYAFQYLIDGELRIADPYTELILTGADEGVIAPSLFPGLKPYPTGKTSFYASLFKINRDDYAWQVTDFERPEKTDLVIYELLIRDFVAAHDYATMLDTLDYLERLGVTAIELLPVNQYSSRDQSWGYDPTAHFATDKFYGPPRDLKRFIDECHRRGMAVILDVVYNHAFGDHSLVRMYSGGNFGPPTAENPWYNTTARHPFNVGFDMNHESPTTKKYLDRANAYWLTEFNVDGFRFDLSKGFTQRFTANDVGAWSAFDPTRVANLTRMANRIWETDSAAYVILEHFADNEEERILSDRGMMLWGNMNGPYSQSAMSFLNDAGRSSDLSGGYYKNRGWNKPHLITYMESHDEPWLMYKNLQFGNRDISGSYDIRDLPTALNRIKLVATFFLTLPGPKMMWQFGELGYDQFLPESGFERTAPKRILWEYFEDADRRRLYDFYRELLKLRRENEVFRSPSTSVSMRVGQAQPDRRITLSHPTANIVIIGNFGVTARKMNPNFFFGGVWYDYFSRDSVIVDASFDGVDLGPGEFRLYSDRFIGFPDSDLITSISSPNPLPLRFKLQQNYPNPFNPETRIDFTLPQRDDVEVAVYNLRGQRIRTLVKSMMPRGVHTLTWDGKDDQSRETASGIYILELTSGKINRSIKMLKLK